jgi:hypothetical protein
MPARYPALQKVRECFADCSIVLGLAFAAVCYTEMFGVLQLD